MFSPFLLSASFPFTPLKDLEMSSVLCLRKIGAMDTARIEVNGVSPEDADRYLSAGSPIVARWRSGEGKADEFIGYVHSYRPEGDGYLPRLVVIAVSAAYPMFNESGRTFYEASINNVAEEIADDYRFEVDTDPHPLIQNQILQQDESDWAMLRRLGDEWGYVLVMDGVRLVFRPLTKILEENERQAIPVLSPTGPHKSSVLKNFDPSYSTVTPDAPIADYEGAGMTPYGSPPIPWQETSGGIFKKTTTTRSVTSELEGEMVAAGKEAKARFPFTAKATVMYPAGKKPLDTYRISSNDQTMIWTVHAVKHIITPNSYVGDLVLGSNGKDVSSGIITGAVDIDTALRRGSTMPTQAAISNTLPIYAGRGANVVNDSHRWHAKVIGKRAQSNV